MDKLKNWTAGGREAAKRVPKSVRITVPLLLSAVRVYLVDTRSTTASICFEGFMKVPVMLLQATHQLVNWPVSGIYCRQPNGALANRCPGATTDLNPLTIVFPFMTAVDALDARGRALSTKDIVDLFKRYEPNLHEVRR